MVKKLISRLEFIYSLKITGEGNWTNRTIKLIDTGSLHKKELWQLVDETSVCALKSLGMEMKVILDTDQEAWETTRRINKYAAIVSGLKVTNDVAERSVALMDFYNNAKRTRDEVELQSILQVTENHRKRLKTSRKCDLKTFQILN